MKAKKQTPGVLFQPQVHRALQRGIQTMVNAIRPTLGPLAGGVAIDHLNQTKSTPELLSDGGVIARRIIELANRDDDMGAMLVRSMIVKQHETVGDGTATAAVLMEAIFQGGLHYIAAGGNAMQLRRHLENAIPDILAMLDKLTFRVEGRQTLTHMAQSLCHDEELAALLGDAFDLLGEYGRLEIREDYGRILRREDIAGSLYFSGLFAPTLLPAATPQVLFTNPAIFICDYEIDDYHELFPVLKAAHAGDITELVIIARNLSEKAVGLLVTNNNVAKFKTIAIKLPGLNPVDRMAALDDLSLLTGAKAYLKVAGMSLEKVTAADFGQARRLWADMHAFGLVGGRGNPRLFREHVQRLIAHYAQLGEPADRQRIQERIGNLLGRVVMLRIGGFTESEIRQRKAIAERTSAILRTAIQQGVIPGGGIALLNCGAMLKQKRGTMLDTDAKAAYHILAAALAAPAQTIFQNAGYDPGAVLAKLSHHRPEKGFDVLTGQVVDVCKSGILDSAPVIKTAVIHAIRTAAMALTIDSMVHLAHPEIVTQPG